MGICLSRKEPYVTESRKSFAQLYPHLLDRPLCEFYVATSHNSYLPSLQVASVATTGAVEQCIKLGARCIELDVFSRPHDKEPIVMHGGENFRNSGKDVPLTSAVSFESCLETIARTAFETTDDPLFLVIENNTNKIVETNDKMASYLEHILGNRLVLGEINIATTPVKHLLGRIVLMTGSGAVGKFVHYINSSIYADWVGNYPCTIQPTSLKTETVSRIYPAESLKGILSFNYDPQPFFNGRPTFIAMNYQTPDKNLTAYTEKFKLCSFLPK